MRGSTIFFEKPRKRRGGGAGIVYNPVMYSYALSIGCQHVLDERTLAAIRRSKVRRFEFGMGVEPETLKEAVAVIRRAHDEWGLEAASVHIPFGNTPWVPSREAERDTALAAIRGALDIWDGVPRITLHGGTEADKEVPHKEQLKALRGFLEEIMPDVERHKTSLNIEYLPRTCLGNTPDELEEIVDGFPPDRIGICLDVNHASPRTAGMPAMIRRLGPRINSFHISDTDGVDECHWFPGEGIIDWPACMAEIKALKRDVLLILEVQRVPFPSWQHWHFNDLSADLAAMERNVLFLENAEEFIRRRAELAIP